MLDIGTLAVETQWKAAEGEGNMQIDRPDGWGQNDVLAIH
jgi:hypothetical protein